MKKERWEDNFDMCCWLVYLFSGWLYCRWCNLFACYWQNCVLVYCSGITVWFFSYIMNALIISISVSIRLDSIMIWSFCISVLLLFFTWLHATLRFHYRYVLYGINFSNNFLFISLHFIYLTYLCWAFVVLWNNSRA